MKKILGLDLGTASPGQFYPEILTSEFKEQIVSKGKMNTTKIFLGKYGIYTAENKGKDRKLQLYKLRVDAISDCSKELFFNKLTSR